MLLYHVGPLLTQVDMVWLYLLALEVHFQILARLWTSITEDCAGGINRAPLLVLAALLHDSEGYGRHTISRKIQLALLVALRDGEAAKVGSDQVDPRASLTVHHQLSVLTGVHCLVLGLGG